MSTRFLYKQLSRKIIGFAFTVHNSLGPGLLESAYEGAFCVELVHAGIPFERQKVYPLIYKNEYVSTYFADLVVDNTVIVELKSVSQLSRIMEAQIINYLRLSCLPVGYLMNFNAPVLEWKRFINTRGRP
ncbi:MAG: GxxExxY protein [Spirochaetales bacterium]|nr:GxxExxY protein [Spirochaetales bacterium]